MNIPHPTPSLLFVQLEPALFAKLERLAMAAGQSVESFTSALAARLLRDEIPADGTRWNFSPSNPD